MSGSRNPIEIHASGKIGGINLEFVENARLGNFIVETCDFNTENVVHDNRCSLFSVHAKGDCRNADAE